MRIAISMLLILFIGCKIATPVFLLSKLSGKEISIATEENDGEKKKLAFILWKRKKILPAFILTALFMLYGI